MFTPKDYDKAMVGNYMKFQDGPNKIRILEAPITGYVYWTDVLGKIVPRNKMAGEGGKPVRAPEYDDFSVEARNAMKGFAAMIVWNYQVEKVQILEIKQSGIMASLEALAWSKSWGDVTSFDIVVTRTKTGPNPMDVEYSVMPEPKEELSKKVETEFAKTNIDIKALYKGEDPFGQSIDLDEIVEDLDG
jgi:hypothetical protein